MPAMSCEGTRTEEQTISRKDSKPSVRQEVLSMQSASELECERRSSSYSANDSRLVNAGREKSAREASIPQGEGTLRSRIYRRTAILLFLALPPTTTLGFKGRISQYVGRSGRGATSVAQLRKSKSSSLPWEIWIILLSPLATIIAGLSTYWINKNFKK